MLYGLNRIFFAALRQKATGRVKVEHSLLPDPYPVLPPPATVPVLQWSAARRQSHWTFLAPAQRGGRGAAVNSSTCRRQKPLGLVTLAGVADPASMTFKQLSAQRLTPPSPSRPAFLRSARRPPAVICRGKCHCNKCTTVDFPSALAITCSFPLQIRTVQRLISAQRRRRLLQDSM